MQLETTVFDIQTVLTKAVTEFQRNRNVNVLCGQLRDELFQIVEAFLIPVIESVVCDPDLLPVLKTGASTIGLRFNGIRSTSVRLLTGKSLTLLSPYFAKTGSKRKKRKSKKRKNGSGRHFGLDYIGFAGRCTTLLGTIVTQAALLCPSFEIARKNLKSNGIELNVKTIRRIVMILGNRFMNQRGRVSLADNEGVENKTVLVSIDGGRLRERRPKRGRKKADRKRQGYHTDWKEPIQLVIQTVADDGTMCKRRLPVYDATMGDIDAAFNLLETYLKELQISKADCVVFCCDGARSYWKRTGPLAEKLGIKHHVEVIDYTHAKQNLSEIIEQLPANKTEKERNHIVEKWCNLLWQGNVDKLRTEIHKRIGNSQKRKKAVTKLTNYFLKNRSRMQYASFRNNKLPTGSGCVESAIRRVINLRLKSPGIFWKPETAEVMLFLRSQLLSGRWDIMLGNNFTEIRELSFCN